MKTFQVLAIVCTALSVASAADSGSTAVVVAPSMKDDAAKTETRRLDAWDNGTKVYKEFPNEGWWSGTVTSYSQATGMYTVTWEDGSTDYYDDSDEVDQMVAWAQADPQNNPAGATDVSGAYPAGTPVSVFEDGEWFDGKILKYGSNTYTIQWDEDDEIEEVAAGAVMDQMVEDAYGDDDAVPEGYEEGTSDPSSTSAPSDANSFGDDDDAADDDDYTPTSGPKYPVGTPVSDFEDEEWVEGEVVDFVDGSYIVQWEDEDDVEYYESSNAEDMQELKQMASWGGGDDDAPPDSFFEDNDLWKIGTPVAVVEDDVLWYGNIDGFSDGAYSITWENGDSEWLDNYDLVNAMVSNAVENPKGMSGAGKFFLSLFIISVCGVGSVYGFKYYQKYQTEKKFSRELDAEDGFRDQPDNLPKII